MAAKPEEIGLLVVHGMGEQKQLYHLRDTARELASFVAAAPNVARFNLIDECHAAEPRIVLDALIGRGTHQRRVRLNLYEVWWADLGIQGGFVEQVRFWLWGLGQWAAEAIREGRKISNTKELMSMPRFSYQAEPEDRPSFRYRWPTHLMLAGAAVLAFLTFFTWSAAKQLVTLLSSRLPNPSLIFLFLGDVMIYQRHGRPGKGSLEDPDLPDRVTIRRRMVRGVTGMAKQPYDRWYILAHSLGCLPAFNALQETELALPNYLSEAEWLALPAALKTNSPFKPEGAKPTTKTMMPPRPAWLGERDGISRRALFDRFAGFVTYGSPLDKFAALWPRIVCLNKQSAVFPMDCEWVNLHEATDPVAAKLDAFAPPKDQADTHVTDRKPLAPINCACRSSWLFGLSHIRYLKPRPRGTHVMAAAITDALLGPCAGTLAKSARNAAISSSESWLRTTAAIGQVLLLFGGLLIAAALLWMRIGELLELNEIACPLPFDMKNPACWQELGESIETVLYGCGGVVMLAGVLTFIADLRRSR